MLPHMTLKMRFRGVAALVGAIAVVVAMTVHSPRERSASVGVESPRAQTSSVAQVPQVPTERTSQPPAERAAPPREQQRALGEPAAQATPRPPAAPVSGRRIVQQVDWAGIRRGSPIPREMPARESDDPEDAGFARQWAERALAGNPAATFIYRGQALQADALRLALPIVSESKRPDDTWAYGVEYELRTRLQKTLGQTGPAPLRVFCNAHGCLCYFEGITTSHPLQVAANIMNEPWARDFGIEPLAQFVTNGGGTGPQGYWWQMVIVTRPRSEQPRK
jgi:hypothetical protein